MTAGEAIDAALPAMPAVAAHYRALPYAEVGKALESVEASTASVPHAVAEMALAHAVDGFPPDLVNRTRFSWTGR